MESMIQGLKQVLALLASLNLVSATVPPPVAREASPVRSHTATRSSVSRPAWKNVAATQSATLTINPNVRFQGQQERTSLIPNAMKLLRPGVALDNPKPLVTGNQKKSPPKAALTGKVTTHGAFGPTFIENKGQWDERVRFQLRSGGKTLWLTNNGIAFDNLQSKPEEPTPASDIAAVPGKLHRAPKQFDRLVFYEDFIGALPSPSIEPIDPQPGAYNYLVGSDPAKWHTNVHGYAGVVYRDVWEGVDFKIHGNGPNLEQEFVVRPGADLSRVQVAYRGIERLEIAKDGSLLVHTAYGALRESKPRIYQEVPGKRAFIDGTFKLTSETAYTFDVEPTNPEFALVIDPTLLYSTYLGGSADEQGKGIAVDSKGSAYVAGLTSSADFPTTPGSLESTGSAGSFVTKLSPLGNSLVYSTFLGAGSRAYGIAVDSAGEAYVTGGYAGSDLPTTANAFQNRVMILYS
jgi:hypothetical protein